MSETRQFQRVVTIGDSIAYGIGSSESSITNLGISGAGFRNGQVRQNLEQIKQGDLVIVSVGLNDVSAGMDMEDYKNKVREYLEEIKAKGGTPVLVGVSSDEAKEQTYAGEHPNFTPHSHGWHETVKTMNTSLQALAAEMNIGFAPTAELQHGGDGIHFASAQYATIGRSAVSTALPTPAAPPVSGSPESPPPVRSASGTQTQDEDNNWLQRMLRNQDGTISPFALLIALLTGNTDMFNQLMADDGLASNGSSLIINGNNDLLDLIAQGESGGDYNIAYGGRHPTKDGRPLTEMTINEVLAWQAGSNAASDAAGRYQIIEKTLRGLKDSMGLTGNEKFDPAMQDRMAMQLLEGRGLSRFISGQMSKSEFMDSIAHEWAALPKSNGVGAYNGDGLNNHSIQVAAVADALERLKVGSRTQGELPTRFADASAGTQSSAAPPAPAPVARV